MARTITTSLRSRGQALLFLACVSVPALLLIGQTVRVALADIWGESYDIRKVHRAIALDPSNAKLQYWLGTLYQAEASSDAMPAFRMATRLNPNVAKYWLGLGEACFAAGDQDCAGSSFERATRLAPAKPSVEWQAAVFWAVGGSQERMLSHLQRLLQLSPWHAGLAFELASRTMGDPVAIWQKLAAPSNNGIVKFTYLAFLADAKKFDLVSEYWKDTVATPSSAFVFEGAARPGTASLWNPDERFRPKNAFDYIQPLLDRLLQAQQYSQALTIWRDVLRLGIMKDSGGDSAGSPKNLLFNANFAQPILNAGFDWHTRTQEFVVLDFPAASNGTDAGNPRRSSLRVDFTVPHNADDEPIFQFVPIMAGKKYELTASVRSDGITSDSGPRLRVVDPTCGQCLDVTTEGPTGTTPWHQVRVEFTAPNTPIVRISVWRPRSRTFPMEISGSAWFSQITLRQID